MTALGNKDRSISDILFMDEYNYVVAAYKDTSIKVWTLSNNKKIVHCFDGHTRPVSSLTIHSDKRMFW